MISINAKTFNPDLLYVFDSHTIGPASSVAHSHEYFEFTLLYQGESFFIIDDLEYYIDQPTILAFNPGTMHKEYAHNNMQSTQIHIGLRNLNLPGYEENIMPFSSTIIQLDQYQDEFLKICAKIIKERKEAKNGYELILKSMVLQLITYLFRESNMRKKKKILTKDELEKEERIRKIKYYIENNYYKNLTLKKIANTFYISQTTLSRDFKESTGDSPINYLIDFRLEKAKYYLEGGKDLTVKEIAELVGYSDSQYFSKIYKEYYGYSPSQLIKNKKID
ncbi:MAG: AraC family transcriptional regulator [Atopostipes sp.]|nr:AraC family transcriptional regulator [Atopostipes sp.]